MGSELGIRPYSTTGIGSLPHRDPEEAVELCLKHFDIPFWPQLPSLGFRETMIPQYTEGMPGLRIDEAKGSVTIVRDEEEIARFYETMTGQSKSAISEDFARGLHAFMAATEGRGFETLKGQITGPLTFTLGIKDADERPIYFDEELRELALMLLAAKARWQVDLLRSRAGRVIIFIDEPILSALGTSSYVGVDPLEAHRLLGETARAITQSGAIPAIHCCGRAEWPLVMDSGIDIMNFDAYEFGKTLAIYPEEVTAFLRAGKLLAWGIVPTTEAINRETPESLHAMFNKTMQRLSAAGIPEELLRENIVLTPACGAGSLSEQEAQRVFETLGSLKEAIAG